MSNEKKELHKIDLLTINELNTHQDLDSFYVASYQRGYRWGITQIKHLLEDINEVAEDKKYCIQPLAVTPREDKCWELIDGQQRSTTIYLIQAALKNNFAINGTNSYNLGYNTRETTKVFLKAIKEKDHLKEFTKAIKDTSNLFINENFKTFIDQQWENFCEKYRDEDNIDNYHIFQAYLTITAWLNNKNGEERKIFHNKLVNQTYIIWHPVQIEQRGQQTVEDFFINMNAGKIKLSSAELIKALFIRDIDKSEEAWDIKTMRKQKFANEWDSIENELHNDELWFFINNSDQNGFDTRIDKLFQMDCSAKGRKSEEDTYEVYTEEENRNWESIKRIFQRLKEWFEEVEVFHLIGFIVNSNHMTIEQLIDKTAKKTKSETKKYFNDVIKELFDREVTRNEKRIKEYSLENLDYNQSTQQCNDVLLLYNIKLIEANFPGQRFPFNLYQQNDTQWSIEHIHPQNPAKLTNREEAMDWLEDYKKRMDNEIDLKEKKQKIDEIEELLKKEEKEGKITNDIAEKLREFAEEVNEELGLHGIGNLALLDKITNSSIGNKSFSKKRKIIIDGSERSVTDKKTATYIPLGTVNNFLKKTTNTSDGNISLSFWSAADAEDYTKNIETLLTTYLPQKQGNHE
ncbi:Protein of unknown function [Pustulibacterium marinum]|uniref:DUF262 domain-containing protein n=1 Tax=Pustulibacterium marinum TaxID=1224947 RepID=A0A1I7GXX6_9FLAO|nr:DUF262 domain-containing protein [Pustulibacterium marinum]SFU53314.1 Protein of unknown function [Pustulibacterium marinum]